MAKVNEEGPIRWFTAALRVRYQETDQMGVVYHSNYLQWMEIGRTEMIRAMGYSYSEIEAAGLLLPVVDLDIQYKQPARYDDEIVVFTSITAFSPLRIQYRYEVRRMSKLDPAPSIEVQWKDGGDLPGELLVTGSTRHVWVNREWKPARLDKSLPELYAALRNSLD
ncbi:acyl-CoA thioesterase [Paenibacillus sp. JSM ZJ436]|uniref:acyl-CoA thioesterase n=1 Tax=Paenibacillus sp. JSM ZJ436 TaxID=3376190 RepID=UPI0037B07145